MATATKTISASEALLTFQSALRNGDRETAERMLDLAAENGWTEIQEAAVNYVDHHFRCPAERIETTNHTLTSRPGDPGYGVVTTHCQDCGAHRAHDAAGLPIVRLEAAREQQPSVAFYPATAADVSRRTAKGSAW
ncbi:hypothetical protein [Microbacterium sp. 22296]|uniref:hypothetical protein n=1 Tax=Microbacterium sp. 22296 TaxID=3453903 RepID=UPI003F866A16